MEIYRYCTPSISIAPMNSTKFTIGQYVKFNTGDEWDGLLGVIENFVGDTITVSCISLPSYRNFVNLNDADSVLELIS